MTWERSNEDKFYECGINPLAADSEVVVVPDGFRVYMNYNAIAHLKPGSRMRKMEITPKDLERFQHKTREWLTGLAERQGWVMEWED